MGLIRVIDFETTGMEPPAQVCEVGRCDVLGDTCEPWSVLAPASILCSVDAMPPEVRAVHHISLAETKEGLPFSAPILWAARSVVVPDIPGWHLSDGIRHEVAEALSRNLPIYIYARGAL